MRHVVFLTLLIIAACGIKPSNIEFGKSSTKVLVSERGNPLEVRSIVEAQSEIYLYENNDKYQIKNDVVTHGFIDPKRDERSLLFWKHKFKNCNTTEQIIAVPKSHELPEYELKCAEEGITIVYTKDSEFVSRVIHHEKK